MKNYKRKIYPFNLLEDCGIDTEETEIPDDVEGVIYYLLYSRRKAMYQRNADVIMDYYQNGIQQSAIAAKYNMTRQRVQEVLRGAVSYLSEPQNRYLLIHGIGRRTEDGNSDSCRLSRKTGGE